MKAVKRVVVTDPDTREQSERLTFDNTVPWDEATIDRFSKWLGGKGVDARLRQARGLLTEIVGTPEHDLAKKVLDCGESVHPNHPEAERAWLEFCALYEHAKRRMVARKVNAAKSAGGKGKAEKEAKKLDARNRKIVKHANELLAAGTEKHELAGKLVLWYRTSSQRLQMMPRTLSSKTIREILTKANVC